MSRKRSRERVSAKKVNDRTWTVASFRCPLGKRVEQIRDCVGDECPSGEWLTKCVEFLEALQLLRRVRDGEVEVT